MISCGKAVNRMEMSGVSLQKMKALTVKTETGTRTGKGRYNLTHLNIKCLQFTVIYFFLADVLFSGCHLRFG